MHALPPERSDIDRHRAEYARNTRNGGAELSARLTLPGIVSETSFGDRQAGKVDSQRCGDPLACRLHDDRPSTCPIQHLPLLLLAAI
jgi:hypothetical protein